MVWFQSDYVLWHSLQVWKPVPSVFIKRACLEALRLATTKRTQRGTGYRSWGHPTQLRISRGSTGLTPLAGYKLYDHKTNDYIRRELRIAGIIDKIKLSLWEANHFQINSQGLIVHIHMSLDQLLISTLRTQIIKKITIYYWYESTLEHDDQLVLNYR